MQGRQITYVEFSKKFVQNEYYKVWDGDRMTMLSKNIKHQGTCLGRIVYVNTSAGERYYQRMLLNSCNRLLAMKTLEQ